MPRVLGSSTGIGVRYTISGSAIVLRSAEIVSTDVNTSEPVWAAIYGHQSNSGAFSPDIDLDIYGTVSADYSAISIDGTIDRSDLFLARTATVTGLNAIHIEQDVGGSGGRIVNNGEIYGAISAISYVAPSSDASPAAFSVSNSGFIYGGSYSISVMYGDFHLVNTGDIYGYVTVYSGESFIENRGTIDGGINLGANNDRVVNRGEIFGGISMGAGNDIYDGRYGFVAESSQTGPIIAGAWVYGGEGNDNFINSTFEDNFDGGSGVDTLRFDGSNAAIVFLDGNEGGGSALGDIYRNIENVVGSATGADIINGSSAGNALNGRGGNDVLRGLGGSDQLIGGVGIDSLSGGAGNDYFTFLNIGEGGDRIADFGNVSGNNDSIRISASGFGLSLPVGQLAATYFRSGTTNLAQDADDRFVFRTTDKTLWFDADGRGGSAPILIADLQDNATFNQTDILIF